MVNPRDVLTNEPSRRLMIQYGFRGKPLRDRDGFDRWWKRTNPRLNPDGTLAVRFKLESGQPPDWSNPENQLILEAAQWMGMTAGEIPLSCDVDLAATMGAARDEPINRARYMASFSEKYKIGRLVVAGATMRILDDEERKIVAHYEDKAVNEHDLAFAASRLVANEFPKLLITPFNATMWPAHNAVVIDAVLKAYSGIPGNIIQIKRIAVGTTKIYGMGTYLDMLRVLLDYPGTEGVIVCNPSSEKTLAARRPATYLTEIGKTWEASWRAIDAGL